MEDVDLDTLSEWSPVVYDLLDIFGVFVAAILGGMVAREKSFDIVGFVIVAIISALGGGMLRDVLIQQAPLLKEPPVALTNPYYLSCALLGALVAYLLRLRGKWVRRFMTVMDAAVMGAWTATGVIKTLNAGLGVMPAVMMGMITAVGGGLIRDITVGRTPVIFGGNTLYATASLIAAFPAVVLWYNHAPMLAMAVSTLLASLLVILARVFEWSLPVNRDYSVNDTLQHVSSSLSRRMHRLRDEEHRRQARAERQERAVRRRNQSRQSLRARALSKKSQANSSGSGGSGDSGPSGSGKPSSGGQSSGS